MISGTDSSGLSLEEWYPLVTVSRLWSVASNVWFARGAWKGTHVKAVSLESWLETGRGLYLVQIAQDCR